MDVVLTKQSETSAITPSRSRTINPRQDKMIPTISAKTIESNSNCRDDGILRVID